MIYCNSYHSTSNCMERTRNCNWEGETKENAKNINFIK